MQICVDQLYINSENDSCCIAVCIFLGLNNIGLGSFRVLTGVLKIVSIHFKISGLNFATLSINLNRYQNSETDSQCYVDNVGKSYLLISKWMD